MPADLLGFTLGATAPGAKTSLAASQAPAAPTHAPDAALGDPSAQPGDFASHLAAASRSGAATSNLADFDTEGEAPPTEAFEALALDPLTGDNASGDNFTFGEDIAAAEDASSDNDAVDVGLAGAADLAPITALAPINVLAPIALLELASATSTSQGNFPSLEAFPPAAIASADLALSQNSSQSTGSQPTATAAATVAALAADERLATTSGLPTPLADAAPSASPTFADDPAGIGLPAPLIATPTGAATRRSASPLLGDNAGQGAFAPSGELAGSVRPQATIVGLPLHDATEARHAGSDASPGGGAGSARGASSTGLPSDAGAATASVGAWHATVAGGLNPGNNLNPGTTANDRLGFAAAGAQNAASWRASPPAGASWAAAGADVADGNNALAEWTSQGPIDNEGSVGAEGPGGAEGLEAIPAFVAPWEAFDAAAAAEGDAAGRAVEPWIGMANGASALADLAPPTTVAAAPGSTAPVLSEYQVARLMQRVSTAMRLSHENGAPLRLRLHPPELGAVELEMHLRDGGLSARLEAETSAARHVLLENLPQLRERLEQHGLRVERFEVGLGLQHGGGRDPAAEQGAEEHAARRATKRAWAAAPDRAAPVAADWRGRSEFARGRVNAWA